MFHRAVTASHRLFFALVPPIVLARRIAHAASWFDGEGTAVAADRLHLTLFILDDLYDVPSPLLATLRDVGAAIAAAPIDIVLDRVGGGPASIALRPGRKIAALDALYDQLATLCRRAGMAPRTGHAFSPHMTLGYRSGAPFSAAVTPVAWTARDMVLIHSHLGRTRHDRVGRWPLAKPEPQLALFDDNE